jgi:hypothetical protein
MGRLDSRLKAQRADTTDDVRAEADNYMVCGICGQAYDLRSLAEQRYHQRPSHDRVDDSEFSPLELEKHREFEAMMQKGDARCIAASDKPSSTERANAEWAWTRAGDRPGGR